MRDPVSHNLSLLTPQLFLNMSISVCLLPPAGFYHHSTPGFISLSTCLPVSPLASLQSNLPTAAKVIFFFFKDTFIYLFRFWLCSVFVAAPGVSLGAASAGYCAAVAHRLLPTVPSRCRAQGSRRAGSAVAVLRLSCPAARGIFPDQ